MALSLEIFDLKKSMHHQLIQAAWHSTANHSEQHRREQVQLSDRIKSGQIIDQSRYESSQNYY